MYRKYQENLLFFDHSAAWTTNSAFWWQIEPEEMLAQLDMTPCHTIGFNREIKSATVINMEPVPASNVLSSNME